MILTLDLPDDLAVLLSDVPEGEARNRYAVALLRAGAASGEDDAVALLPPSPEDLAAIGRGLADADVGRMIAGPDFFAHLDTRATR